MTPKEKAQELVKLYFNIVSSSEDGNTYINNYNQTNRHLFHQRINFERTEKSKQCALIAIDEVMNTINFQPMFIDLQTMQTMLSYEYWERVKQEIEKI